MSPKLQNKLIAMSMELRECCDSVYKHFTYLLDKNRIVSVGFNQNFKSHPLAYHRNYYKDSRHSEIDAYVRLRDKNIISDLTMVNIRLSKTGVIGMSKPCPKCYSWVTALAPRKLFYTNMFGEFVREW